MFSRPSNKPACHQGHSSLRSQSMANSFQGQRLATELSVPNSCQPKPCKPRVRSKLTPAPTAPHRKAVVVTQFQNFIALLHFRGDDRRFAGKSGPRALHFDFVFRFDLDVLVFKIPAGTQMNGDRFLVGLHTHVKSTAHPLGRRNTIHVGYFPANRFHRLRIVHLVVWASLPPSAAAAPHRSGSFLSIGIPCHEDQADYRSQNKYVYFLHFPFTSVVCRREPATPMPFKSRI